MSTSSLIASVVCSLLSLLLCAGVAFFFFCLILGVILLRRRKKKVTAREAVRTGFETASMVFRRNSEGKLVDPDEDEPPGTDEKKD